MKTMSKSAKKFFAAAVCMSMLLTVFVGCNQLNGGATEQKKPTEQQKPNNPQKPGEQPKSAEKRLLTFLFSKEHNKSFTESGALGTINELSKTIGVILPNGIDITKLKARFLLSDGAKASVNGKAQESGKTENDFSNPVSYTITAENGSTQIYTVRVTVAPAKPDVPEGITEKEFSELTPDQQKEIKSLYGYYWAGDGTRNECPAINAGRLAVYSNSKSMSMGFTNLRWSNASPSTWVCFSYGENDGDFETKRIVFTFMKDNDGTIWLWDTIVAMNGTYGPYVKGKDPDKFEESGKTYYTYDKATYDKEPKKSPKMFEPALK